MKSKFYSFILLFSLVLACHAVTFSVSPSVVSNNYSGLVSFHIAGLTTGDTVRLQQFYDANSNGAVDPGEFCVRSEIITDGDPKLFDGATNINLVRDEDATANGAITASFRFAFAPDLARAVGSHIFRLNSPANHFANIDIPFTIVGVSYPQTVQGTVLSNGVGIAFARVALVQDAEGNDRTTVAAGTADVHGNYSLEAPPGAYQVLAFRAGYVGNLTNFPLVVLSSNATITTNVSLIPATSLLSGAFVDSTNFSRPALPNAELLVFSTNLLVALTVADSNADFSVPVTANNVWSALPSVQNAMAEGYLLPEGGILPQFQTFSGPNTSALIPLKRSTALIDGRVADQDGNPIAGASLSANADFGQYDGFALSDTNGLYSLAIDGGEGNLQVQNAQLPPLNDYLWAQPPFFINNGATNQLDISAYFATAHIRGHVTDDSGAPLAGLFLEGDTSVVYGLYSQGKSDAQGFFDVPVFAGEWDVEIFGNTANLIFPELTAFAITNGVNVTNDIVGHRVTGSISGHIVDSNSVPVPNVRIAVTNQIGSTNFVLGAVTDSNGFYSVSVFNSAWTVAPNSDDLEIFGYTPAVPVNISIPPANATVNFIVGSFPPPQILTTNLPDGILDSYYFSGVVETNGSYPVLWSLTSGSLPDGLSLDQFGYISGTPTNLGTFSFTLEARDPRGSNDVKTLSITIDPVPTGPPQILTSYLNDFAVGCPSHGQFQATNGTQPYTWALASGSDPMPPGLTLNSDGSITGTPTMDGYYNVNLTVTDAESLSANGSVSIQVNTPLQPSPSPLPVGEIGVSYFGALYTSGGAQPQTWSLISGSLPPKLNFDPATGYITGAPTTVGVYPFTLEVTDGCTTLDFDASITNYPALQILTTSLPPVPLNSPYTAQLQVSGGAPPYSWYSYNSLPFGLTLGTDGSITGEVSYASTNEVQFAVYDAAGNTVMITLPIIATSQPILDLASIPGRGQFTFRVAATPGQDYLLQSSSDLTNWADLQTTNAPDATFYFTATNASVPYRFYRVKAAP